MGTRVIAVASQKGGVGKTTSVVNLAAWLALLEARVLVIDLDPQGSSSRCVGLSGAALTRGGTFELFAQGSLAILEQGLLPAYVYPTQIKNLSFLPASVTDTEAEIRFGQMAAEDPELLAHVLNPAINRYDFILIDCPANLSALPRMAFAAADSLLVPLQCEQMALSTLPRVFELVRTIQQGINRWLKLEGLLITMFDPQVSYAPKLVHEVRRKFKSLLLPILIPRDSRLSEATAAGRPVVLYDMHSPGSQAYRRLAEALIRKYQPQSVSQLQA
jgi:chromosome partitioning protein